MMVNEFGIEAEEAADGDFGATGVNCYLDFCWFIGVRLLY